MLGQFSGFQMRTIGRDFRIVVGLGRGVDGCPGAFALLCDDLHIGNGLETNWTCPTAGQVTHQESSITRRPCRAWHRDEWPTCQTSP